MDTRLIIIAAVNVVVWTGLFLFLLFALMRGGKDLDHRLEALEARHKDEQQ